MLFEKRKFTRGMPFPHTPTSIQAMSIPPKALLTTPKPPVQTDERRVRIQVWVCLACAGGVVQVHMCQFGASKLEVDAGVWLPDNRGLRGCRGPFM